MKRIVPNDILANEPCSVVAVACAMGRGDLSDLRSPRLHKDGYLSLDGMNALVRKHLRVQRVQKYKRGERPYLRDFCHNFSGKAVVCVTGHYVYVEAGNYYSFLYNGSDEVIAVWELKDG